MIRKLKTDDRNQLIALLKDIDEFNQEEKNIAVELINEALLSSSEDSYVIYVYDDNDIKGYYCIGRRALTDGVYDLFWIVVQKDEQKKGIGKQLLLHAEQYVKDRNGRWLLIETSSKPNYNNTRNFYMRNFYTKITEVKDFYKLGDNLIVFGKYLIM